MAGATIISRVLGMVRELVYSAFMGTGVVADAFFFAFSVPNLFRRLLGEGVLSAAFIPIFKEKEKKEGHVAMWHSANAVICALVLFTVMISVVVVLGITVILPCLSPDSDWRLLLELLRIMFPYVVLVCFAAVCMGMLNARGYFFIPAIGASTLNIVMIASVLVLAPLIGGPLDRRIFALAIGIVLAGVVQAAFQMPSLHREGYRFEWVNPWSDPTVRNVISKMLIGSIGVAAFQINVMLTQCMAFGGHNGKVISTFNYAVRLMELPQGVFGISMATYLLPTLSALAIDKKFPEFRSTLRQGIGYLTYVNLLAAVLLMTLAEPIVRLLFQHGRFGAASTERVSQALICLALGLVAFSTVNVFARAFYALSDLVTPMKISVFCLTLNLFITAIFLYGCHFGAAGLGLANTITAFCNVTLLYFALRKKIKTLELEAFGRQMPGMITGGVAAGLVAWFFMAYLDRQWGHARFICQLGEVFLPMIAASLVYTGVTVWLKVSAARDIFNLAGAVFKKKLGKSA